MSDRPIRVLLIEDNPADQRIIQELLAQRGRRPFELECAQTLRQGLDLLSGEVFDAVMLDLSLPESSGIDTFFRVHQRYPEVPIVILSGLGSEEVASRAVGSGAQDYLLKDEMSPELLVRAIRYAIERRRLSNELEEARQLKHRDRELKSLERLSGAQKTAVTAKLFSLGSVSENVPQVFDQLVHQYGEILEASAAQNLGEMDEAISKRVQGLVERGNLALLKADARDVLEIHSSALKSKLVGASPEKAEAYVEQGRLLLVELLGGLLSYYRNYAKDIIGEGAEDSGRPAE